MPQRYGKKSFDIILNLKDKISSALRKVKEAFDEIDKKAKKATWQTSKFVNMCNKLEAPNLNSILNMVERVTDGMTNAIDKSMSFGQSVADLSSITGITGKELEQLETNARKFGEASGLGASTASRAYSILASQIQVADIGMDGLNNLLTKSVTLAHASGMSMDASAEALAATINQFGLGAEQADRVINVLAAGSKYGAAEISELSQSFKVVGSSASAMGLNVEETAGALEVLSKANLKGSEAGTALRNIILKLNTELGIDLGETSLEAALSALQPKLTDATYLSKDTFGDLRFHTTPHLQYQKEGLRVNLSVPISLHHYWLEDRSSEKQKQQFTRTFIVTEAIEKAVLFYNTERPHMSINMMTPQEAATHTGEIKKGWTSYRDIAIKNPQTENIIPNKCLSLGT